LTNNIITNEQSTTADLWRMRIVHLLSSAGAGIMFPFIGLFYQRHGLSGTEIGLLSTASAIIALVIAPLWGRWSDSVTRPRLLLQGAFVGNIIGMLILGQQVTFIWMAVVIAIDALISAGEEPLLSNLTMGVTREKSGFGSVRLWGSLGWAIVAPLAGLMIEWAGIGSIFWGYGLMMGLTVVVLFWVNTRPPRHPETEEPAKPDLRQAFRDLLKDKAMVGLAIALVIAWLTSQGRYSFEGIYLNQLGAPESVIGWVITVGALVELPAMLWADRLMRRYGAARVLKWSFLIEAASLLIVLSVPTVPSIFVFRVAAGIAYSLNVVAVVVFISERSPNHQSNTRMALYMVTIRGLVGLVSGPISGYIFDTIGAYYHYVMAFGGCLLAWLALHLTVTGRRSQQAAELS
jgi:MFS transporter, PPP family, 3-phenylpropionic acid transporter